WPQALHHTHQAVEIGAGAEGLVSGAREDDNAHRRVVVDVLPSIRQTTQHFRIDGIAHVRTVQCHQGNAVLLLVEYCQFRHIFPLSVVFLVAPRRFLPGFPLLPGEGQGEVMRYPTRSVTSVSLAFRAIGEKRSHFIPSPWPSPRGRGEFRLAHPHYG